jgi:uncharacterized protein (DUF4415 family)
MKMDAHHGGFFFDSDILDWFKKRGKGYQTMINTVLRAYKDSREKRL